MTSVSSISSINTYCLLEQESFSLSKTMRVAQYLAFSCLDSLSQELLELISVRELADTIHHLQKDSDDPFFLRLCQTAENRFSSVINSNDQRSFAIFMHAGVGMHAIDTFGNTPLMHAVMDGNFFMVNELIQAGASTQNSSIDNFTPLIYSVIHNETAEITQKLLDAGAPVDAADRNRTTSLMHAILREKHNRVEPLLKAKANPNLQDDQGYTALMFAVARNDIKSVELLLQYDANPYIKNDKGKTAFDYAKKNERIMALLAESLRREKSRLREFRLSLVGLR